MSQGLAQRSPGSDVVPGGTRLTIDTRANYRIAVQGILDESWSERLGSISIQVQARASEAPVTVLSGTLRDQAALAGVLDTLYSLGLPLLSVEILGTRAEEGT